MPPPHVVKGNELKSSRVPEVSFIAIVSTLPYLQVNPAYLFFSIYSLLNTENSSLCQVFIMLFVYLGTHLQGVVCLQRTSLTVQCHIQGVGTLYSPTRYVFLVWNICSTIRLHTFSASFVLFPTIFTVKSAF